MAEDRVVEFSEGVSVTAPDDSQPLSVDRILVSEISTPATPASGKMAIYAKTDQKLYKLDDAGLEAEVGAGGGGGADIVKSVKADNDIIGTFDDTGNNATYGNGGTITAGSLTINTTAGNLLNGTTNVYAYIPAADGSNDFFGVVIAVPLGWRGRHLGFKCLYKTDTTYTDDDVIFQAEALDGTSAGLLTDTSLGLDKRDATDDTGADFTTNFYVPSDCTSLSVGFQNTSTTTTLKFYFDRFELSADPFVIADFDNISDWTAYTPGSTWSTNTTVEGYWRQIGDEMHCRVRVSTSGAPDATNLAVDIPSGYTIDTTKMFADADEMESMGFCTLFENGVTGYNLNGVGYKDTNSVHVFRDDGDGTQSRVSNTSPFTWGADDHAFIDFKAPIVGWSSKTEHIVTPTRMAQPAKASTNDTSAAIATSTNTYIGFTTVFDDDGLFTNSGSANSSTYTSTTYWTAPRKGKYRVSGQIYTEDTDLDADDDFRVFVRLNGSSSVILNRHNIEASLTSPGVTRLVTGLLSLDAGDILNIGIYQVTGSNVSLAAGSGESFFSVEQIDTVPVLGAIPSRLVGYVKETQTSGTDAGAATADTIHTRDLANGVTEGDFTKFGSINTGSDQFTLDAGKYAISGQSPAYQVNRHQVFLYDVTNTSYVIEGTSGFSAAGDVENNYSFLMGNVTINASTTYEIRHWTQSAKTSDGLGNDADNGAANPQTRETYSQLRIEKLS